jgi:hypothetical protein
LPEIFKTWITFYHLKVKQIFHATTCCTIKDNIIIIINNQSSNPATFQLILKLLNQPNPSLSQPFRHSIYCPITIQSIIQMINQPTIQPMSNQALIWSSNQLTNQSIINQSIGPSPLPPRSFLLRVLHTKFQSLQ